MQGSDGPGRAAFELDAHEALRSIYDEFLLQKVGDHKIPAADRNSRLTQFENGHPYFSDEKALLAAQEKHIEISQAGGTDREAATAASKAFYENIDRGPAASLDTVTQTQKPQVAMDRVRYANDPNYRNQIHNRDLTRREAENRPVPEHRAIKSEQSTITLDEYMTKGQDRSTEESQSTITLDEYMTKGQDRSINDYQDPNVTLTEYDKTKQEVTDPAIIRQPDIER